MLQSDTRSQISVANAKHTILNPVIPYTGPIGGGLHPGEIIIIQGTVPPDADRFQIDLSSGCSTKPRSDVALHFSPRFRGSPCVVCNSLLQEEWGKEETLQELPYKRGAPFETIILVHQDVFKVAVNGVHLLEYKHRIPVNKVDTFSISGKVRVHAIGYIPNSAIFSESGDLSLPYKGSLLKGLNPGQHITIKGQVSMYPHRTYLVTARSAASSGTRALKTLRSWGLEIDEALFLAGAPKGPMLEKIRPHIFFDDQMFHVEGAAEMGTVACHVPYGIAQRGTKSGAKIKETFCGPKLEISGPGQNLISETEK